MPSLLVTVSRECRMGIKDPHSAGEALSPVKLTYLQIRLETFITLFVAASCVLGAPSPSANGETIPKAVSDLLEQFDKRVFIINYDSL